MYRYKDINRVEESSTGRNCKGLNNIIEVEKGSVIKTYY